MNIYERIGHNNDYYYHRNDYENYDINDSVFENLEDFTDTTYEEDETGLDELRKVDHTDESMTSAFLYYMNEAIYISSKFYEIQTEALEGYMDNYQYGDSLLESVSLIYESSTGNWAGSLATKLSNAIAAIWNWIKQWAIKIGNKISGFIKNTFASTSEIKSDKVDDVKINKVIILKNDNIGDYIKNSELYKLIANGSKLLADIEGESEFNDSKKNDYSSKIKEIKDNYDSALAKFNDEIAEVKKDILFKEIRDHVLNVIGRHRNMIKDGTASVDLICKAQLTRINNSLKRTNDAKLWGEQKDKLSLISEILTLQSTILQQISKNSIRAIQNSIRTLAVAGNRAKKAFASSAKSDPAKSDSTSTEPDTSSFNLFDRINYEDIY